jgi:FdrA protein
LWDAIINGVGFGFSNNVKKGSIGIIAASGTGLQSVTVAIDDLGEGVSHAIGTGGRDLKESIGAITSLQTITFLEQDPDTKVIIFISKPSSEKVVATLLKKLQKVSKPVVVFFIGELPPARQIGNIHFALSLLDAAQLSVNLMSFKKGDDSDLDRYDFVLDPLVF